jgi:hypothetical protein
MASNFPRDPHPHSIEPAAQVNGERTDAAFAPAIEGFMDRRARKRLIELLGTLEWDRSFDPKAERSRR